MSDVTQKQAVLAYARKHKFITRLKAAMDLHVMNLWARISELEVEDGYRFDRRRTTSRNGKRVLEYWLVEGKQQKRAA